MYGLTDNQMNLLNSIFGQYPNIEQVILYGSRAKGNFRPGSDIDLTMKGEYINIDLIHAIKVQISHSSLPYQVDLSSYSDLLKSDLTEHIDRVGIVLYQRLKYDNIYPEKVITLLEEANGLLRESIYLDSFLQMKDAMQFVGANLPFVAFEAKGMIRHIKSEKGEHGLTGYTISSLSENEIYDNVKIYLLAVDKFVKKIYPNTLSVTD